MFRCTAHWDAPSHLSWRGAWEHRRLRSLDCLNPGATVHKSSTHVVVSGSKVLHPGAGNFQRVQMHAYACIKCTRGCAHCTVGIYRGIGIGIGTGIHICMRKCMHSCICIYTCVHIYIYIHTQIHVYVHVSLCAYI